jgi:3-oxoacyl-[acyl-carrier protein] reductase
MSSTDLAGTTAVVTGAAGELGGTIARRLLHQGVHVVAVDRDADSLRTFAVSVASCPTAHCVEADVSTVDGVTAVERTVLEIGHPLSAWVNNAGIVRRHAVEDLSLDEWHEVLDVNLTSALIGSQAAFRLMKARRQGSIVNLSSIMGHRTKVARGAYGTSKAGVEHLTRYLALEFGPHGVRVNAVAPGLVESAMSSWATDASVRDEVLSQIPLRRYARRDEIADVVELLITDKTSYVTGHVLHVDGGWPC